MFPRLRIRRTTCLCDFRHRFRSHFSRCRPPFPEGECRAYPVTVKSALLKAVIDVCRRPFPLGRPPSVQRGVTEIIAWLARIPSPWLLPLPTAGWRCNWWPYYPAKSLPSAPRPPRELRYTPAVYNTVPWRHTHYAIEKYIEPVIGKFLRC